MNPLTQIFLRLVCGIAGLAVGFAAGAVWAASVALGRERCDP